MRWQELPWAEAFLEGLKTTCHVGRACQLANVAMATVYNRRKNDPEFAAQWDEVKDIYRQTLKDEAYRRAVNGVIRKKWTASGQPVMDPETGKQAEELDYSDSLLNLLLRSSDPEFRDVHRHQHEGGDPAKPIVVQHQIELQNHVRDLITDLEAEQ